MTNALLAGLTGLRANQNYLDVIGNNLANSNTTGYKASRVTFSDILSQSIRPATAPTNNLGGTNPVQLGRGAGIATVDQNFTQGTLLQTGRTLDLAIQGNGFFVLQGGGDQYYTRVGAFGLDSQEYLVDLRSGLKVQSTSGSPVQIRLNSVVPPDPTTQIDFRGNLPGEVTGPTIETWQSEAPFKSASSAQVTGTAVEPFTIPAGATLQVSVDLGSVQTITLNTTATPTTMTAAQLAAAINSQLTGAKASVGAGNTLAIASNSTGSNARLTVQSGPSATLLGLSTTPTVGSEAVATSTTALNDLKGNTVDYVNGDRIRLVGSKPDGTPVDVSFTYGTDGTTLGDLVNFANTAFGPGASVSLSPDGTLSLASLNPGEASLTLTIQDSTSTSQVGQTNFATNRLVVTTEGRAPDKETSVVSVYDSLGILHSVTVNFERQIDGRWIVSASIPPEEGTITNPNIASLSFGADGSLPAALASTLDITWAGGAGSQTVRLGFGTPGGFDGVTQFGASGDVFGNADGAPPGSLSSIGIRPDGTVEGFFTNGKIVPIDTLQVALFTNPAGLTRDGNGLLKVSSNSGAAQLATPGSGSAGTVVSGSLEGSNVDVAEEFVRLIEAQRGFQANARVISTTDQVLAELVNLGR